MSAQTVVARDLISSLPDEVVGKILSLLWTNRAASTSVLSKRWRNLLALVDNLDLHDASGNHRYFCDFVDNKLALLSNSATVKRFSLDCEFNDDYEASRVDSWIRTVLERGFLELHLSAAYKHCIDSKFFTSSTLVKLTICAEFFPDGLLPPGGVFFPMLKTLTLVEVAFSNFNMYRDFILGCPVLEELFLHYDDDGNPPSWYEVVWSSSIKRLTIYHNWPDHREDAHGGCWFVTPSLEYLEYSSYVAKQYEVYYMASLVEARLDLRSWERPIDESDEDESDESDGYGYGYGDIFGDVTNLVAGISNVKTLHLSSNSLEVFHLCCDTMPVFHNLLKLSFESDKEIGWQVVPLLLNNSPNLQTLVIKGLVHQVTNRCGDACSCIPKRRKKKKKMMIEKGVCCLSTCRVKVLHISGYQGTRRELKQMRHFLANLNCLETVKVGVKVNHRQDNDAGNRYLRVTNALMELPRVSSNSRIHFF